MLGGGRRRSCVAVIGGTRDCICDCELGTLREFFSDPKHFYSTKHDTKTHLFEKQAGFYNRNSKASKNSKGFFDMSLLQTTFSDQRIEQTIQPDFFKDLSKSFAKPTSNQRNKVVNANNCLNTIKSYQQISNTQWYIIVTAENEQYYYNRNLGQITKELPHSVSEHQAREKYTTNDNTKETCFLPNRIMMSNSKIQKFLHFKNQFKSSELEDESNADGKFEDYVNFIWSERNKENYMPLQSSVKTVDPSLRGATRSSMSAVASVSNDLIPIEQKISNEARGFSWAPFTDSLDVCRSQTKEDVVGNVISQVMLISKNHTIVQKSVLSQVDIQTLESEMFGKQITMFYEKQQTNERNTQEFLDENDKQFVSVSLNIEFADAVSDPDLSATSSPEQEDSSALFDKLLVPSAKTAADKSKASFYSNLTGTYTAVNYALLEKSDLCILRYGGARWLLDRTKDLCQSLLHQLNEGSLTVNKFYVLVTNLCIRAKSYAILNNLKKSMACVRLLYNLSQVYAYYAHGSVLKLLGFETEAGTPRCLKFFQKSLQLEPNFYPSVYALLCTQTECGMFLEASRSLILAKQLNPQNYAVHIVECRLWIKLRRFENAAHWIKRLSIFPERVETWILCAEWHLNRGNLRATEECLIKATKIDPNSFELWMMYAYVLQIQGQFSLAAGAYSRVLKSCPVNNFCLVGMSTCMFHLQQYVACVQLVDKALSLNPNCFEALYNRSKCAIQAGEYNAALVSLERCLEIRFNDEQVNVMFASALSDAGDHRSALKHLENWLAYCSGNSVLGWITRGYVLLSDSQTAQALFCFERALELKPIDLDAQLGKMSSLFALGRTEEAESFSVSINMSESLKKQANEAAASCNTKDNNDHENFEDFASLLGQIDFNVEEEIEASCDKTDLGHAEDPQKHLLEAQKNTQIEYDYVNRELHVLTEKLGIQDAQTLEDVNVGEVELRLSSDPDTMLEVSDRLNRLEKMLKPSDFSEQPPNEIPGVIKDHIISSFDIKKKEYVEYEKDVKKVGKSIEKVDASIQEAQDYLKKRKEKTIENQKTLKNYWHEFSKSAGLELQYEDLIDFKNKPSIPTKSTKSIKFQKMAKKSPAKKLFKTMDLITSDVKKKQEQIDLSLRMSSSEIQNQQQQQPNNMNYEDVLTLIDRYIPKTAASVVSRETLAKMVVNNDVHTEKFPSLQAKEKYLEQKLESEKRKLLIAMNRKRMQGKKAVRLISHKKSLVGGRNKSVSLQKKVDSSGLCRESVDTACIENLHDRPVKNTDTSNNLESQYKKFDDQIETFSENELEQLFLSNIEINDNTIENLVKSGKKPPSKETLMRVITRLNDRKTGENEDNLKKHNFFKSVPTEQDLNSLIESKINSFVDNKENIGSNTTPSTKVAEVFKETSAKYSKPKRDAKNDAQSDKNTKQLNPKCPSPSDSVKNLIENIDMDQIDSKQSYETLINAEVEMARQRYYAKIKSLAFPPFDETAKRKEINRNIKRRFKKLLFKMITLKPEMLELLKTPEGVEKLQSHLSEIANSLNAENIKKITEQSKDLMQVLRNPSVANFTNQKKL